MRFGGTFNPRFYTFTDAANFGGTFIFSNLSDFAARTPTLFQIASGNPRASFSQHEANLFFQDEIRLRQNLNLTLGLRYDWQARIGDHNNFAPRLAVAYAPGDGKTVIRAGAGIFYDRLSDRATQRSLLIDGVTIRELVIARPSFDDPLNSGDQIQVAPSVWRIAPELQSPYLFQGSLAVERSLWSRDAAYGRVPGPPRGSSLPLAQHQRACVAREDRCPILTSCSSVRSSLRAHCAATP